MGQKGLFVGLTTIDVQFFVDEFPRPNRKVKTTPPGVWVGGPAANAAVAFSALGGQSALLSVVGQNAFSSFIHADFQKYGVSLRDVARGEELSPVVASVFTDANGDRTIVSHHPAQVECSDAVQSCIDDFCPQIVLLDGFYPEFSVEVARRAFEKGIPVVVDAGSWKAQYLDIFPYARVVICSADFFPPGTSVAHDVLEYLTVAGVPNVAISRGEESVLIRDEKGDSLVEVPQVQVVDTLGAGDFLHGAFCYFFSQGMNFREALQRAVEVASFTCTYHGTRGWVDKLPESIVYSPQ